MGYQVPFFSVIQQHTLLREEFAKAFEAVLQRGQLVRGPELEAFENAFAALIGVPYAAGVANGTDALQIALRALKIGPGDEVITPAWSWVSTAEVVALAGATPVFADSDPEFYTVSEATVGPLITPRTKAVLAVHLYGQCAPMTALSALCRSRGVHLVEDCAQGILSTEGKKVAGTAGTLSAFSFYPTKNLGALGDAGLIATGDRELSERVRRLANHGALVKHDHEIVGTNSRLDELQAAFLRVKLRHLEEWTASRIEKAAYYTEALKDLADLQVPSVRSGTRHTFHLYVVRTPLRDSLREFLERRGIQALIHYPRAISFLAPWSGKHTSENFPVAERLQHEVLSLPLYPELTREQQDMVVQGVREYFGK
jgi:dTDP-4-amino-4,6-dideoxygalactose transaminase